MDCECGQCLDSDCCIGPQGFCGAQGSGSFGPQGAIGSQGVDEGGAQGERGSQGIEIQGPQGDSGTQGPISLLVDGPQGDDGFQANSDLQGSQGYTGQQGDTGLPAPPLNVVGTQGFVGSQGPNETGPQGYRGIQGVGIDNGPQGVIGMQGRNFVPTWRFGANYDLRVGPFTTPGVFRFYTAIDTNGDEYEMSVVDSAGVALPGTTQLISGGTVTGHYISWTLCAYLPDTGPYNIRIRNTSGGPSSGITFETNTIKVFIPS